LPLCTPGLVAGPPSVGAGAGLYSVTRHQLGLATIDTLLFNLAALCLALWMAFHGHLGRSFGQLLTDSILAFVMLLLAFLSGEGCS